MKRHKHPEHINHERWLVSYADFITLLFAFFVVMFAVSRVDTKQLGRFSESFQQAVGLFDGRSYGLLPDPGNAIMGEGQGVASGDSNDVKEVQEEIARQQQENPNDAIARVKVIRRGRELLLRLDDNILFDSGDDRVRDGALKALRTIAALVKERKVELRVEGHTDNIPVRNGRFRSNWELSTARATAVIAELAQTGFTPERLSAAGYGEFHPVGPNDGPEGRAHNRRVDIVITSITPPRAPEQLAPATASSPPQSPGGPPTHVGRAPGSAELPPGSTEPSPRVVEPSPKVAEPSPLGQTTTKEGGQGHGEPGHDRKNEAALAEHSTPKPEHAAPKPEHAAPKPEHAPGAH
jgi:chemotaxis protein MotB